MCQTAWHIHVHILVWWMILGENSPFNKVGFLIVKICDTAFIKDAINEHSVLTGQHWIPARCKCCLIHCNLCTPLNALSILKVILQYIYRSGSVGVSQYSQSVYFDHIWMLDKLFILDHGHLKKYSLTCNIVHLALSYTHTNTIFKYIFMQQYCIYSEHEDMAIILYAECIFS